MICCPVLFVISLALADKAFKNKFTSLAQIHSLIVPPTTDRIRLKWDDDWKQRPIFRDVEPKSKGVRVSQHDDSKQRPPCRDVETRSKGVRISKTKSLTYSKHRHHLVRIGRICHYRKRLQTYDWRRGSGKKLNGRTEFLLPVQRVERLANSACYRGVDSGRTATCHGKSWGCL